MKNILFRLFLLTLFLFFNSFSTNNEKFEIEDYQNTEIYQEWYAAMGTTRNANGINYSIALRILGIQGNGGGCLSISEVKASPDGNWQSVAYYSMIGESCTYYVNVGGNNYYFTI